MNRIFVKYLVFIISMFFCLLIINTSYGQFEHPLPLAEIQKYKEQLKRESMQNLSLKLDSNISYYKKELIINELSQRNDNGAANVIADYLNKVSQKIKQSGSINPYDNMLKAEALICMVKIESHHDESKYINELENLLKNSDPFVVDASAVELGKIGTPLASDVLKRNEKGGRPLIKINRMRIETKNMAAQEFVSYILKSVNDEFNNSDSLTTPAVVAERSLLAERGNKENLIPLIQKESTAPPTGKAQSKGEQGYSDFIQDMQKHLERMQKGKEGDNFVDSKNKSEQEPAIKTSSSNTNKSKISKRATVDFKKKPIDSLLILLNPSRNKKDIRQSAKALGDLYIEGAFNPTSQQTNSIQNLVMQYIDLSKSEDASAREEAKQQIERLWHLAVPALLKYLDSDDITKAELAAKSLILMRNEEIIKSVINQANSTSDSNKKKRYVFILTKMQEQRTSLVPDRKCLGQEESSVLYNTLVVPAIEKLKK